MLLAAFCVILCIYSVKGVYDCPAIETINCSERNWTIIRKIKHCLCSCITVDLTDRRYLVVDFSQCEVFLACQWAIQAQVFIHNDSDAVLHNENLTGDKARRIDLTGYFKEKQRYLIKVYTKCKICDDSCKFIRIDVPEIIEPTIGKVSEPEEKPDQSNIMIPLYAVIIPGIICLCIMLICVLYQKRKENSSNLYHNANIPNNQEHFI